MTLQSVIKAGEVSGVGRGGVEVSGVGWGGVPERWFLLLLDCNTMLLL